MTEINQTLKIVQTDTLTIEYVPLEHLDLSTRFLWRLTEPYTSAWLYDGVTLVEVMALGIKESMERLFLKGWHKRVDDMGPLPEESRWLELIYKVKLVRCRIERG